MSYSRRAYTDTAKIFSDQVRMILSEPLTKDERMICLETVQIIADQMADLFEADNPKGFDRKRYLADSGTHAKMH